jgi:Delta7-sterol 5-desaturase
MNNMNFEWWQVLVGSTLRYVFVAGVGYLVFYIWKKERFLRFKIQQKFPGRSVIVNELKYSASTILIFAAVIYACMFSPWRGYTQLYSNISDHGLLYYLFTIPLAIFIHDTYFYWIHRFMHLKRVFPYVHKIHHHSHNPTPLAAFSFHPLEALLEIGVLPLIVFSIPIHQSVILIFGIYNIVINVSGHLGYEFLPAGFMRNRFLRNFTTSTHHNMHHHYGSGNYGLYFNFWDKILNTNHERYEQEFVGNQTNKVRKSTPSSQSSKQLLSSK